MIYRLVSLLKRGKGTGGEGVDRSCSDMEKCLLTGWLRTSWRSAFVEESRLSSDSMRGCEEIRRRVSFAETSEWCGISRE